MSSKRSPEIRIVYPDATPAAMLPPVNPVDPRIIDKLAVVLVLAGRKKRSKTLDVFARALSAALRTKDEKMEQYIPMVELYVKLNRARIHSRVDDPFAMYGLIKGDVEFPEEIEQGKPCTAEVGTQGELTDGDFLPGLLDDIEDGPAPAGEVIGHDE